MKFNCRQRKARVDNAGVEDLHVTAERSDIAVERHVTGVRAGASGTITAGGVDRVRASWARWRSHRADVPL